MKSRTGTGSSLIQVVCDVHKGHSIEHPKFLGFPLFYLLPELIQLGSSLFSLRAPVSLYPFTHLNPPQAPSLQPLLPSPPLLRLIFALFP